MTTSTYTYKFTNGTFTITRYKFDWFVKVNLNDGFIMLDRDCFLTKKYAKETTINLLNKYNLL